MTAVPAERATLLSDHVAEEIRVLLTRKRMSQRQLALVLGVSPAWLNYRLTGVQAIDLNDMQRIAEALDVTIFDLLPGDTRDLPNVRLGRRRPRTNRRLRYPKVRHRRPTDHRRPGAAPTHRRPNPVRAPMPV